MTNTTQPTTIRAYVVFADNGGNTYFQASALADNRASRHLARIHRMEIDLDEDTLRIIADEAEARAYADELHARCEADDDTDDPYDEADDEEFHDCRKHDNTAHAGHAHPCTKTARAACRRAARKAEAQASHVKAA